MKKYDVIKKMVLKGETAFLETEQQIDEAVNSIIEEEKAKKTDGYYEARFNTLLALVVGATSWELDSQGLNYKHITLHSNLPIPKEYTKIQEYWRHIIEKYRDQNLPL
jgi:hypothetical protein